MDSAEEPQASGSRIELGPGVSVPESALRWQYARSRGPGGQNVNKVNTKAELWIALSALSALPEDAQQRLIQFAGHRVTTAGEIHIAADSSRSQEGNRLEALARLRELIVRALHRPKTRRKSKPSRASRERRLDTKRRRSQVKARRRGED